jgi:lysozyme family protein
MAQGNFEACLNAFWIFDGVRVDAAPGEKFATSYGVTQYSWADAVDSGLVSGDMNAAPVSDFAKVLKFNYWEANNCDALPIGVDLMVFNDATLSGDTHAAELLQRIVGSASDGVIGPKTLAAISKIESETLILKIASADMEFLSALRNAPLYLNGWKRREVYMQTEAIKMIAQAPQKA